MLHDVTSTNRYRGYFVSLVTQYICDTFIPSNWSGIAFHITALILFSWIFASDIINEYQNMNIYYNL